jgi:hypothetical protein
VESWDRGQETRQPRSCLRSGSDFNVRSLLLLRTITVSEFAGQNLLRILREHRIYARLSTQRQRYVVLGLWADDYLALAASVSVRDQMRSVTMN